ncbi:MAG: hypothetical protein OEY61_11585 [Gammaproteobacteria bacterium]|nr:hypothetical protein [Gammaproteobacteria bacterium]
MRKSQLSLGFIGGLILGLSYIVPVMAETVFSEQTSSFNDEDLLFANIPSIFSALKYEQKTTEDPTRISVVAADETQR